MNDEIIYSAILGSEFSVGKKMTSPLPPDDANPSFWLFRADDRILWHDARKVGRYKRDAVSLAMEVWNCNYAEVFNRVRSKNLPPPVINVEPEHTKGIDVNPSLKPWEKQFWDMHGVSERVLKSLNIFSLAGYYIDDEFVFGSYSKSPAYAYVFGKNSWQLYRPMESRTSKFRSHNINNVLFGYNRLTSGGDVIITSSYKDCAVLTACGYKAVAPSSEVVQSSVYASYSELRLRFDNIYVLYDNDDTGRRAAAELAKNLCVKVITLETKEKDPADIAKRYGIDSVKSIF
jgi:hypothetical protein